MLVLGGCFGPDVPLQQDEYAPAGPAGLPGQFIGPVPSFVEGGAQNVEAWWTGFRDPVLDRLVARGLDANPEVLTAESRVRESRAVLRGARAGLRPTIDGSAEAGIEGSRETVQNEDGSETELGGTASAFLGFDWNLDIFGGVESAVRAAEAQARLREAERRDAALAVIAGIARSYIELRGAQRRLELADEALDLQRRTLDTVRGRVESGLASDLDLSRAEAALAAVEAGREPIRTEIRRGLVALAVLLGRSPGSLPSEVSEAGPLPTIRSGPGFGVPTDLVRQRPDLAAAEAALLQATEEIGIAEAALYPRFTLPGQVGIDLTEIATGEMVTSVVGSLFLAIDAPLFDAGRREAELEAAHGRAEQALLAYHGTLLDALEEVEFALEGHDGARRQVTALERAVDASETAFNQASALYRQGLASFIEVLDAQRALNDLRQQLATSRTRTALEAVNLYEAIGLAPPLDAVEDRNRKAGDRPAGGRASF